MHLRTATLVVVLLLLFIGLLGRAIPIPTLNVPALVTVSDLIVFGNVRAIHDGGVASVDLPDRSLRGRVVIGEIETDGVLKGMIEGRAVRFRYITPEEPIGYASVSTGYQLLFLKKIGSDYSVANPYHASLPAVPTTVPENGDSLAKIAVLLGAVLESSAVSFGQKQQASYALSTIRNSQSTEILRSELGQPDSTLRLGAAGFLLLRNDLAGMEIAEQALKHPEDLPGHALHNLDYAISEGVQDEKAVPTLARLARLPEVETRRAVASALRHTRSRSALQPLASLLDDSDLQVRHEAVVGLAEITGDLDSGPNLDVFRSREHQYTSHWHDWALANGLLK